MAENFKLFKGQIYFETDCFVKSYDTTLTIENNTFILDVKGDSFSNSNFKIIQGEFQDLGYVTFVDCYFTGRTLSVVSTFQYNVLHIIEGVKINDFEELNFSSLSIEMPILKNWINKTSIKGNLVFENKIEYSGTQKFDFYKSEIIELSASLFCKENFSKNIRTIEEYYELKFFTSNNLNLFDFLNYYRKTKLLLNFFGQHHSAIDNFYLKEDNLIYENQDEPLSMKLHTSTLNFMTNPSFDFVFSYNDLIDSYQNIFECWFNNKKLEDSINLISEKSFLKLSGETYFLNTCFSLETLHRKHFKNYVYEEENYEQLRIGIIEKLNPEEKKLFLEKLQFANEPSFRSRLKDFNKDFGISLKGDYKPNNIIGKIVDTRNYLVHRGEKKNILENIEMTKVAKVIENVVKINIFRLIGVDENKIQSKIKSINYDDIFIS